MYKVNKKDEVPIYLFHQGTNYKAYEFLGSHSSKRKGVSGAIFRVWAPHALSVSVVGDFNDWNRTQNPMEKIRQEATKQYRKVIHHHNKVKRKPSLLTDTICISIVLRHRNERSCSRPIRTHFTCRPDRNQHPAFMSLENISGKIRRGWIKENCRTMWVSQSTSMR